MGVGTGWWTCRHGISSTPADTWSSERWRRRRCNVVVPRSVLDTVADNELLSVLMFAALAVILSICSEADAFVAAGLPQFSLTSRLVFLVVGPVIDLKLVAMHVGVFGRRFAARFAPVTLAVAIVSAVVVGQVLL